MHKTFSFQQYVGGVMEFSFLVNYNFPSLKLALIFVLFSDIEHTKASLNLKISSK